MALPRSMTAAEKRFYAALFPNLKVDATVVTDEATPDLPPPMRPRYNCLAWTLGYTDRWVWPRTASEADFDALYASEGYIRDPSNGPIAAWKFMTDMTHGCVSGTGHGPDWESKCGEGLRIQHGIRDLESTASGTAQYGAVRCYYRRRLLTAFRMMVQRVYGLGSRKMPQPFTLSEQERDAAQSGAQAVAAETRSLFDALYAAWREGWSLPTIAMQSNPAAVCALPQFDELVAMGPMIIPLLVREIAVADDFRALQVYDALVPSAVSRELLSDGEILLGEQHRGRVAARRWLGTRE